MTKKSRKKLHRKITEEVNKKTKKEDIEAVRKMLEQEMAADSTEPLDLFDEGESDSPSGTKKDRQSK